MVKIQSQRVYSGYGNQKSVNEHLHQHFSVISYEIFKNQASQNPQAPRSPLKNAPDRKPRQESHKD